MGLGKRVLSGLTPQGSMAFETPSVLERAKKHPNKRDIQKQPNPSGAKFYNLSDSMSHLSIFISHLGFF